ncbi:MAG: phosphohydrolase [Hydrogenothermaceae bacterium]|nr:phosphohydrolase [Hydrogenothermaceae bacterium]
MKAREVLIALISVVFGMFLGFVVYKKRKEILRKLEDLTLSIQDSLLYEKVRGQVMDIKESIKALLESSTELPREKEDEILNIVEEKIRKLEEIMKS